MNAMWLGHPGTGSGMHCVVAMVPCDNCVNKTDIPFIVRDLLIPPECFLLCSAIIFTATEPLGYKKV